MTTFKSATGELIQDKTRQMERWVENYAELYSTQNHVIAEAIDAIESLSTMSELDDLPTLLEMTKAIDHQSPVKAPGNDGIPSDVIKCGGRILSQQLLDLLCQCWEEGAVPPGFRM